MAPSGSLRSSARALAAYAGGTTFNLANGLGSVDVFNLVMNWTNQ